MKEHVINKLDNSRIYYIVIFLFKDKNILEPIYRSQYISLEKAFREFKICYNLFTQTYNFIYEYLHKKFESLKL